MIERVNGFLSQLTPAASALIVFLLTQAGFGLIWLTHQENRISALEGQNRAQQIVIDRLDAKEHEFNLTVTREATIIRNNVENLRADVNRLQEQQGRIISALDGTNNLIQEHLRNHPR